MMHKIFQTVSVAALSFTFVVGCATKPKEEKAPPIPEKARWESSLRVKDLRADRGQSLSVAVLGEREGRLRLEASAIMGVPVASFVLNGDEFRCAVYQRKSFYQGKAEANALEPLLRLPLSPRLLHEVMFEIEPRGSDWRCQSQQGRLEKCSSEKAKIQVLWERSGDERTVRIHGPGYEATWAIAKPRTEVQFKDETFRLEAPAGFRRIQL